MEENYPQEDAETFGALEAEDALDAFNDETFGGGGLGEEWREDAHEELAALTEQERAALQQSNDFFNFGSDGEELGGELEDALEPGVGTAENGGHDSMVHRMDQLSLQTSGLPPAPLTVQTSQLVQGQGDHYHHHHLQQQQQQQQVLYHQPQPQVVPGQQQFPL